MLRKAGALSVGLAVAALSGAAMVSLGASPAQAVVYCKTVGVPKGCVVRPTAAVVAAPAARGGGGDPRRRCARRRRSRRHADESRRPGQPRRRALIISFA